MKLKYTGRFDSKVLASGDLKKVGIDGFNKTTFPRNEVIEVEDSVGEALTDPKNKLFGDDWEKVEEEKVEGQNTENLSGKGKNRS